MTNSDYALQLIVPGQVIGLGSGRAASAFIRALGEKYRQGFKVRGVPTSQTTAALAGEYGIPLIDLDDIDQIDLTVDGADEVAPNLNLIKGLGGALVREKIVAASSRRLVILVGAEKLVSTLGDHGVLPVEVVPFALPLCLRRLSDLGCPPSPRARDGKLFVTDNGNHILDARIGPIADPASLEAAIEAIPGVVGTGLFLGMTNVVYVQDGEKVQTMERPKT